MAKSRRSKHLDRKFQRKRDKLDGIRFRYHKGGLRTWRVQNVVSSQKVKRPKPTNGYLQYLTSPQWRAFRIQILAQRGARCESCGTRHGHFDLHHKTYKRLGRESPEDVIILCRACHDVRHQKAS